MSTAKTALKRETRKAETRRALIDAAGELFARQGIEATSIDEIASSVGLTKGAVYAHFGNKSELVEETLSAANAVIGGGQLESSSGLGEFYARIGGDIAKLLPMVPRRTILLYLEYLLYVMRDPARHRTERHATREQNELSGAELEEHAKSRGFKLPLPGAEMAALLNAAGNGIALAVALDARAVSPEAVEYFFAAIGYGLEHGDAVSELLSTRPNT